MRKLNQRQELFCQYIFTGMTATDAAIKAGYSPKYARENCPKLLQNTIIKARLASLNARTESKAVATVMERKERLTTFIYEDNITDKGNLSRQSNISSIDILNKMGGDYPPAKVEIEPGKEFGAILSDLLSRLRGYNAIK